MEDYKLKKYIEPEIDILLFDGEDDILTDSGTDANYAARQLNEYMFEGKGVDSTTTVKIENIKVIGE